ncbi:sensor histidine kinase [Ramlibacter sp.]|uniref:sensor histidine kinase n=1 Tax=Ramlibacter sp. TaxID=1917967 RepID=UPI002617EF86|nr:sensor histidine kinase [Ramlibacter sp.]MDB5955310.1 two-component sensor histidine kinase [Ramlibacter sp.]
MPALQHPPPSESPVPRGGVLADVFLVAAIPVLFFVFAAKVELSERVVAWTERHEFWQLDELPLTLVVLCACLAWFGWRRLRERSREIHARMQMEGAMHLALQQNRELARRLLRLQEDERGRIARELHDELAQECVGIRVEAAGIEDEGRARDLPAVAASARAIREAVDRLHAVVRGMLTRLRPPMLDALGLEASLHALGSGWSQRHGIACNVQVAACCEGLLDEARVALYRVAQEALTNVARHAGAAHVQLALATEGDGHGLLLTVDDDGCGMAQGRRHAGLGLVGMAERVAGLGGTLALTASPRGGLRVAVRVPAVPELAA